jgi:hypothetical protein
MANGWDISLSASKLGILRDCPLCFYMQCKHKVDKPRGIFPSLPGGMDRILKESVDSVRGQLPWFLEGQVPGVLFDDLAAMKKMRHWQSGLKAVVQTPYARVSVIGALDDLLQNCPAYSPLDWKTKGDVPKNDGAEYYQTQVDLYGLLLRENNYPLSGFGYLAYVYPSSWDSFPSASDAEIPMVPVSFGVQVYKLECDPDRAFDLITEASRILMEPTAPQASPQCELCLYLHKRSLL